MLRMSILIDRDRLIVSIPQGFLGFFGWRKYGSYILNRAHRMLLVLGFKEVLVTSFVIIIRIVVDLLRGNCSSYCMMNILNFYPKNYRFGRKREFCKKKAKVINYTL